MGRFASAGRPGAFSGGVPRAARTLYVFGPDGFQLPDDWNLTLLYRYATGTPYKPGQATLNPVEAQKQENTAYGPYTSSADLKFEK